MTDHTAEVRSVLASILRECGLQQAVPLAARIEVEMRKKMPVFAAYVGAQPPGRTSPIRNQPPRLPAARSTAGSSYRRWPDDDLCEILQIAAAECGGGLSQAIYSDWRSGLTDPKEAPHVDVVAKRFGHFEDACSAAGVSFIGLRNQPGANRISDSDIRKWLRDFVLWVAEGGAPDFSQRAYETFQRQYPAAPSMATISRRFSVAGGWTAGMNQVLEEARR